VRALLIINPRATAIAGDAAVDMVVRELSAHADAETTRTRYRGHAHELAAAAATAGDYDLVLPFGGDGTVNEVVNGLMAGGKDASARPAIAPVPGGGANVFARTLGLPTDPFRAVRQVLDAADAGTARCIGLGLAAGPDGERHFTFSAGLGVDAEVVADMELRRADGYRESAPLFMWTALRRFYTATDRRHPALTMEADGEIQETALFMGVVTNSSPWTYVGSQPFSPAPHTDFNSGLDMFALRRLDTLTTLHALKQMMHPGPDALTGRGVVSVTALPELAFQSTRPIAFHIDGEYVGETEKVAFRHLPSALRVFALCVMEMTPFPKRMLAEPSCAGRAAIERLVAVPGTKVRPGGPRTPGRGNAPHRSVQGTRLIPRRDHFGTRETTGIKVVSHDMA
jgi:diacylglycerol kinase family enzyme